jgi:hypothetical protein
MAEASDPTDAEVFMDAINSENYSKKIDDLDEQLEKINVEDLEASLWETELELALFQKCDYGSIRNIIKCRRIPEHCRAKVWQVSTLVVRHNWLTWLQISFFYQS